MKPTKRRILLLGVIVLALIAVYFLLDELGILAIIMDSQRLKLLVSELGYGGPAAIMILMAVAVIVNPIPSAPIALVAGALYGHTWGTVYVVVGAGSGAVGAFSIARLLGDDLLQRIFGKRLQLGWLGSQNALTGMVFLSRLIPFLSFDLVSYGAGLTPIKTWRFVVATFVGLIPASFLLTHFGGELADSSLSQATFIVLLMGGVTLLPVAILGIMRGYRRHRDYRK